MYFYPLHGLFNIFYPMAISEDFERALSVLTEMSGMVQKAIELIVFAQNRQCIYPMPISEDFEGALSVLTEMSGMVQKGGATGGGSKPMGAYSDIQARCEVTRVLLLMYLQVSEFNNSVAGKVH